MTTLYNTLTSNPSITRRGLFKIGGLAAVGGGLETILGSGVDATQLNSRIKFEDALHNPSLRERYIREMMEEMFGNELYKYFSNIYYDHDKSKVKAVIGPIDYDKLAIASMMGVHG